MFRPMFIPPADSPALIRCCHGCLPALMRLLANLREVRIPPDELQILREAVRSRALLAPNHPTGNDPYVLFWLSRELRVRFNYLAAREVLHGPRGHLMNRLGTYSVIRGVADRESIRATRRLLAQEDRRIVIFPEGEIYEHNDRLLAFQSGVVQIGFWTLDDLERLGKDPEMPVTPIAIKYACCDSPRPAIESGLRELEQALGLSPSPRLSSYQRLRRAGESILSALEREEGVESHGAESLGERIDAVRSAVMARVAQSVGTVLDPREPPADQLHQLQVALRRWVGDGEDDQTEYDERLYRQRLQIAVPLHRELLRLQNWIAVSGDYVAAEATAERFLDVLGRLEKEVFGEVRHRVPRVAHVRIAPSIHLEEHWVSYRNNKKQTVAELTRRVETEIREMLRSLSREATPISLDQ